MLHGSCDLLAVIYCMKSYKMKVPKCALISIMHLVGYSFQESFSIYITVPVLQVLEFISVGS